MNNPPLTEQMMPQLKSGLERALISYQTIQTEAIPTDAKGFTAYHNACKAALMHIALLVKLIQGSDTDEPNQNIDWIASAREALKSETEEDRELLFS